MCLLDIGTTRIQTYCIRGRGEGLEVLLESHNAKGSMRNGAASSLCVCVGGDMTSTSTCNKPCITV